MPVLAGDIGGTKTLLQIADFAHEGYRVLAERRFENQAYRSFSAIVDEFIDENAARDHLTAACLGVAGPITATSVGEQVKLTNLPWIVDSQTLRKDFGIPKVRLINDFQATGYGVDLLSPTDLVPLQEGITEPGGVRALIGAGTGLGQGLLFWRGDHYEPLPTEGGHVDFAPTDATQLELLRYLWKQYGRASYERVLSGRGLINIYHFLCERAQCVEPFKHDGGDHAAAIAQAAAQGNALALEALQIFVKIYGAQAGNLALTVLATGGVYITGGIAPKILTHIQQGGFIAAFRDKGRMSPILLRIPVYVVTNPAVGLMGTALAAQRL